MFFADTERRIANRARQFPFWHVRGVLFWFGVHNWTELRREKAAFCRMMSRYRPSGQQRWNAERTKMTDMSAERCGEY